MSSNAAIADRANSDRLRRKTTPPRQRADHYLRPREQPTHSPPRHVPPAIEHDILCDFCGEPGTPDNPLTFDRSRAIVVTLCQSCVVVLDEELADDDDSELFDSLDAFDDDSDD